MAPNLRHLLHRPLLSRTDPLDRENAASRISAYVYGNILILAALIPLTSPEEHTFQGVAIVVGTGVSTFVAHAFAEGVGQTVRTGSHLSRAGRWEQLRDSVPILSATVLPAALLAVGWWGLLDPAIGQIAAEVVIIARIASTNFVIGRLRGEKPTRGTLLGSIALAVAAALIVSVKIVLTH
ncbi:hypothetical protein HQ346_23070 [Rhodococcus sp. BP-252]|uniref:Uncharacterized protein n=1 Tax=Rhodococcoides kyotonense TaxID=398843 RepID=A0A177Y7S5_9NOCA|nr:MULTISPECIES: hypothetical protein [Rhodococcus]MBY6413833.1 hypothetical protein [Rhodococcus sp. BP-320]MBY6419253.1 hypothetical protein [Rhodococcus sp. BP-321]MBY6424096.1 hypothetical protein [Rhodococcus sp. BP-324]MBY6428594.1 hypothetical protein [Rhodococcus sp. BP-323]MBY6434346.1 hypothetical protein [Rhodococcus sp. BP-322]